MIKYIHGSEDSLDIDVYYVFDKLPEFQECRNFCSADPTENRNIIVINNGIVTDCFIGTCDEINNGLIDTYNLHQQQYPLIVNQRVERDEIMKYVRATRGILSILSKTHYRTQIKEALNNNWTKRLNTLKDIDLTNINFNNLGKRMDKNDILKVIAFQIGQSLGLLEGKEFYTKSSVSNYYKDLTPFLYRQQGDINNLNSFKNVLVDYLGKINVKEFENKIVLFTDFNKKIDLKHENYIIENSLER